MAFSWKHLNVRSTLRTYRLQANLVKSVEPSITWRIRGWNRELGKAVFEAEASCLLLRFEDAESVAKVGLQDFLQSQKDRDWEDTIRCQDVSTFPVIRIKDIVGSPQSLVMFGLEIRDGEMFVSASVTTAVTWKDVCKDKALTRRLSSYLTEYHKVI